MSRLKDRHKETGQPNVPALYTVGKIRLGRQLEGGSFEQFPYFELAPFSEIAEERTALLKQVAGNVDYYNPGQGDPLRPTVMTIQFLSTDEDAFAQAAYKAKGSEGVLRCLGDGELIQYKIGAGNVIQISGAKVVHAGKDSGVDLRLGQAMDCPGSSSEGRYPWCKGCRGELVIKFAIYGCESAGVWMMATGDKRFYNQFWTQIDIVKGWIGMGWLKSIVGVPFELRRTPPAKRQIPITKEGATKLINREMPGLAFRVHPQFIDEVIMTRMRGQNALMDGNGNGDVPQKISAPAKATDELPGYDAVKEFVHEGIKTDGTYFMNGRELREQMMLRLATDYFPLDSHEQVATILKQITSGQDLSQWKAEDYWEYLRTHILAHAPDQGAQQDDATDTVEAEVTVVDDEGDPLESGPGQMEMPMADLPPEEEPPF